MQYIIVDLEATCWDTGAARGQMEIIEIGAVRLAGAAGPPLDEFARFVRPVVEPTLSEFCTGLTSIAQHDVDTADPFSMVFPEFLDWIGDEPFRLCSWGQYDLNQFCTDCARHALPLPASFENHINVKKLFAAHFSVKPSGMAQCLELAGLPLVGTHHRGIDDARNIARLAMLVLPQWEAAAKVHHD